jgi:phosphopantothenoylcysteine decarboxylase/phosphopantothenate--cysteine ligase
MTLSLHRAPDTLASVASLAVRPFTVGFAAETHEVEHYARLKLERKHLDMIVANQVGSGLAFDTDDNEVLVLWPGGKQGFPRASKQALADALMALIAAHYSNAAAAAPGVS